MILPARAGAWSRCIGRLWVPVTLAGGMLLVSVWLGPDASWDLRNYHLYDAYALLRKPDWLDLVPAQRQTFNAPMADLPSYWLRVRLNDRPRLLDALLALPSAVAAVVAWAIGRTIQRGDGIWAQASLLFALLIGATGAAGLPTTGTSMSEMPAGCFMLAGLLIMLRCLEQQRRAVALTVAGALFGAALGLKLTQAIFVPAAALALLLCAPGRPIRRLTLALLFCLASAAGALAIAGAWWLHLFRLTGSPVFPYMNQLFRSPLFPPVPLDDNRFKPHGILQSLFQPFLWSIRPSHRVSELDVRDPRLALAWLAILLCLTRWRRLAAEHGQAFLLVFCIAAAILWQRQSSILRYLAPIELLSGLILLLATMPLRRRHPGLQAALLGGLLLVCVRLTVYPDWGRAQPADRAASVTLPAMAPGAMVLLLTDDPMAYVAAFADPRVRFVGVSNNLLRYGPHSALAGRVQQAVRTQTGPIWGLEIPSAPDPAAAVLASFGLHRLPPCVPVRTNLEADGLRLCRLAR